MASPSTSEPNPPSGDVPPTLQEPLRRSGRRTMPTRNALEDQQAACPAKIVAKSTPSTAQATRRNPKRRASEASKVAMPFSGDALEEAIAPLKAEDIEEWDGWIEMESEPVRLHTFPMNVDPYPSLTVDEAFFNTMLRELGVNNVKAQEVFSIDPGDLALLPKPVYGLIFLFQYLPTASETDEEEATNDVWFANQTTANACATVALLNIIMNAPDIQIGDKLREFYDETRNKCTPLRGHLLSTNKFIRTIHNSFTRRMDHLNADLALENEASAAAVQSKQRVGPKKQKRETKAPTKAQKRTQAKSRKASSAQYGFHFIAYVPVAGSVWELDGFKRHPRKIESLPAESSDWTMLVQPQIEARMMQYEGDQLSFNLLALCKSPLALHAEAVARSLAALRYLDERLASDTTFTSLVSAEPSILNIDDELQLSEFDLKKSDIIGATVPEDLKAKISEGHLTTNDAYELRQKLVVDTKVAMGEYRAELVALAEDQQRVRERKKNYGPALHKWVQKLAQKGVLEDIIKSSS
ncbi:hypothetical protein S7711_02183 [Stachybotrys chartarum IBT 7711]|uniref:Ubiquitin carboxyl-terminal hydrolase n=1 Tax=Stachybotrys chartarum (strain CBS 109288 / IBT 7711) TaxID=1280523 RepID=A0A084ARP9_STACB|nr:hypothetical protein S7711_02183 [Stachybotrys chartarum IBT 7711]KFA48001.1 hypothetical protein S40293_02705 [Stachybotrys chartarum IBT 40293]